MQARKYSCLIYTLKWFLYQKDQLIVTEHKKANPLPNGNNLIVWGHLKDTMALIVPLNQLNGPYMLIVQLNDTDVLA